MTAVVAPAGAGKTALAAHWVRHSSRPTAWLALDESDGDPSLLCAALVSAVERLAPGATDRAIAIGKDPGGAIAVLRALIDDLELLEGDDALLVIDDLHHLDGSEAGRSALAAFVDHTPDWLHLLVLSRRRPGLAVDRLRATGRLADIGFEALRFSEPEDLELLTALCPDTPEQELASMAAWSGGWAAALQLAALAVRSKRTAHLPGGVHPRANPVSSAPLVHSYLWHEALRAERVELVELLLSTSVVDRMNYGLAEALTGRADAGDLLLEAEQRGLFVTSFDSGGWFEVHTLVREALLAELGRRSPASLREQHARAARWLEDMGDGMAAIEHWLDADEPAEALRLLAATSMGRFDGGPEEVDGILARIPPEVSGADAVSLVRLAWSRLPVDRAGFLDALASAELAVTQRDALGQAGNLGILRAASAWLAGDWPACIDHALASLDRLGDAAQASALGRFARNLVTHAVGLEERWSDRSEIVGEGRAGVAGDSVRLLAHEGARAMGLALAGQPLDSLRVSGGLWRVAHAADLPSLRTELHLSEAVAARELGDRDRAEPALEELADATAYPLTHVRALAGLELVEMRMYEGDVPAAAHRFHQLEELVHDEFGGPGGRSWLARAGVLVSLGRDDLTDAERWAGQSVDSFWRPVCDARVLLAAGHHPDAVEALHRAAPRCPRHHVVHGLLLARAISEVSHETAAKSVEVAVERAAEHGMLQTVAADGGPVLDLVERAAWRVPPAWMDRLRRVLTTDLGRVSAAPGLVEELTNRERDVLRLLPSRLTLREIASELFVSQNTLKFHLRVIYRKLEVNSRGEAVEVARRLGLLVRS